MSPRRAKAPPTSPPAFLDLEPAGEPVPVSPVSITSSKVTITMDAHDARMLQRAADFALWTAPQRAAFDAKHTTTEDPRTPSACVEHACSRIAIALSTAPSKPKGPR